MEWPRLREEVRTTAAKVGELLRAFGDGGPPLSRVKWSAVEVGAHLVSLPRCYRRTINTPLPFPDSVSADNQRELELIEERDPGKLADRLSAEVDDLLRAYGEEGSRPVYCYSVEHTVAGMGGILLTELLVHGWDLADARGQPWPISREQAVAGLRGILPPLVLTVDPAVARTANGVYHLHFRGGDDWSVRVENGAVTIERAKPERADLHVSADPVVFLRNAYGLISNARAALTGGIVTYGRRPWLAIRFAKLFVET